MCQPRALHSHRSLPSACASELARRAGNGVCCEHQTGVLTAVVGYGAAALSPVRNRDSTVAMISIDSHLRRLLNRRIHGWISRTSLSTRLTDSGSSCSPEADAERA